MSVLINSDCSEGKHRACDGRGWDVDADQHAPCPCSCHGAVALADRFRREIGGAYELVAAGLERDHEGVVQHRMGDAA